MEAPKGERKTCSFTVTDITWIIDRLIGVSITIQLFGAISDLHKVHLDMLYRRHLKHSSLSHP